MDGLVMTGSKNTWLRPGLLALALVLLLFAASLGIAWQHLHSAQRLRTETATQVQLRGAQVTSAVTTSVSILFHAIDTVGQKLASSFVAESRAGFEHKVKQEVDRLPPGALLQVAVIDASGYLAYSNLGMAEKLYLGDREHFKAHLGNGPAQLFISKPVLGRVSKQWSIQFSQPIYKMGQLVGVLVMSLSPTYLQDALMGVVLKSDDTVTILRRSGEFIARNREVEAALGKAAEASRPFLLPDAMPAGNYVAKSKIDDVERWFHWQHLEAYPVTVLLGLSTASALQPVERAISDDKVKTALAVGVMWIVVLGAAWLAERMRAHTLHKNELEFVAMNDTLTGLRSRHALFKYLDDALPQTASRGERAGLLYLDLDGFKAVNDRYGHATGDRVLQSVGHAIKSCMRSTDVAARIGGDEFVVVISALESQEALAALVGRLAQAIGRPIQIGEAEVRMGASFGAATFPEHGGDAQALLAHADLEMYLQKEERWRRRGLDQAQSVVWQPAPIE